MNGAVPPKNSALTTAAAELHISANWTAIAKFEGEFGVGSQITPRRHAEIFVVNRAQQPLSSYI